MGPYNTYGDTDEVAALRRTSLNWQNKAQDLERKVKRLRQEVQRALTVSRAALQDARMAWVDDNNAEVGAWLDNIQAFQEALKETEGE